MAPDIQSSCINQVLVPTTRKAYFLSLAVLIFLIGLPNLGSAQDQGQRPDQRPVDFDSSYRVTGFELRRLDPGVELWIESNQPLELVGMEIKQPNRIVLQLPRHRAPNHLVEGSFEGDLISNGRISVQETERGPLTKISFSVWPDSKHTLLTDGNILQFKLRPADYRPLVSSDLDKVERQVYLLKTDLSKSEVARHALRKALTASSTENQTLLSQFEQLQTRRQSLEMGLSTALSELSRLEDTIGHSNSATASAAQPAEDLEADSQEKVVQLQSALSDYASARYALANQLDEVTVERDLLRSRLNRLETDLEMTKSLSVSLSDEQDEPKLVEDSRMTALTTRPTNLRSGASDSASPVALLASAIRVVVVDISEEWVQVSWENQKGWIPREDLHLETD